MIFINPWLFHNPKNMPDLTPHNDKELVGCLAGACGYIVSTIIYAILFYLCFTHTKGMLRPILIMIDSAVIYPILMICLVKLSFKIGGKINNRKKFNNYESEK